MPSLARPATRRPRDMGRAHDLQARSQWCPLGSTRPDKMPSVVVQQKRHRFNSGPVADFHPSPSACCRNATQGVGLPRLCWPLRTWDSGRGDHRWGYATIQMEHPVAMTSSSAASSCVTPSQCRDKRPGEEYHSIQDLQQSANGGVVPSIIEDLVVVPFLPSHLVLLSLVWGANSARHVRISKFSSLSHDAALARIPRCCKGRKVTPICMALRNSRWCGSKVGVRTKLWLKQKSNCQNAHQSGKFRFSRSVQIHFLVAIEG